MLSGQGLLIACLSQLQLTHDAFPDFLGRLDKHESYIYIAYLTMAGGGVARGGFKRYFNIVFYGKRSVPGNFQAV